MLQGLRSSDQGTTTMGRHRKNRDRFGIIGEILAIAQQGERKSHIMYQANLTFCELTEYLVFLTEVGLIEQHFNQEEHAVMFKTTAAGFDFMKRYGELREMMTIEDVDERKKKEVALGSH
jgi:predicted transcriptional regulator